MAQWNPYYGVPNQQDSHEEQNYNSINYYGSQPYGYGAMSMPPINYNNYYVPNNLLGNLRGNLQGNVYNAHDLEAAQQFACYSQNATGFNQNNATAFTPSANRQNVPQTDYKNASSGSKLTATAAEFKPSSTNNQVEVNSQTFYNNNKQETSISTGAIPKTDTKNLTNADVGRTVNTKSNTNPEVRGKFYNRNSRDFRNISARNYKKDNNFNDPAYNLAYNYPKSGRFNKQEPRDNYSKSFRRQEYNLSRDYNNDRGEFSGKPSNYRPYVRSDNRFFNKNSRDTRDNKYNISRYDKTYENWRSGPSNSQLQEKTDKLNEPPKPTKQSYKKQFDDDISQRDRLTDQVNKGTLECLVCCERIRQSDKIWHCQKCYHIFHFKCITKWGTTSKDEKGWRCPACQHVCTEIPSNSLCYCGKISDPQYQPGDTAHSCGEVCSRLGVKPGCVHRCNLLCHPGPCPKCEALVSKKCNCGATTQIIQCSIEINLVCKSVCNKLLECGVHFCTKICHPGDCITCTKKIEQDCFCGKTNRTIPCDKDQKDVKNYSCEQLCDKLLKCGNHNCKEICHPGDCPPCLSTPELVKTCPCGNSKLKIERTSCLDPIPCCEKECGKRYPLCGTPTSPHNCKSTCHFGECPPCPLSSFVRCRCGHMSCEIKCATLNSRTDDARCGKKCTKKRSCGRHKCNQLCCIDIDHICPLPCNHMLTCGLHRCEQTCHKGRCNPCWRISFEELFCECGTSMIYPPVHCGTKRPHCNMPCIRQHDCHHETLHTCHSQPECPPCTILTSKICYGGHERRTTIPCHQKEFSCGLPCGKDLPCGQHKCQSPCHKGPCLKEGQICVQSCFVIRETCGHPCGLPCHSLSTCPESPCKESVKVTCECGVRSSTRACVDMAREYQRIATSILASKMADMQLGHTIDIGDIIGTTARKQSLKTLECNDECRLIERNRRLAIGLQIRNPDLSAKLTPRYSDFMRTWAKKDQIFCQMVHDKLTELVQLAKQSKQKSRSYSFPSMNREKRQFIHEYCEHFGCESAAYDQEPNRNVVATAARDKAWLPSCSLLELIQRENGQRKVPGPILNRPLGTSKISDSVSLKISKPNTTSTASTSFASTLQ